MGDFSKTFAAVANEAIGHTLILDMISFGYVAIGSPVWKAISGPFDGVRGRRLIFESVYLLTPEEIDQPAQRAVYGQLIL